MRQLCQATVLSVPLVALSLWLTTAVARAQSNPLGLPTAPSGASAAVSTVREVAQTAKATTEPVKASVSQAATQTTATTRPVTQQAQHAVAVVAPVATPPTVPVAPSPVPAAVEVPSAPPVQPVVEAVSDVAESVVENVVDVVAEAPEAAVSEIDDVLAEVADVTPESMPDVPPPVVPSVVRTVVETLLRQVEPEAATEPETIVSDAPQGVTLEAVEDLLPENQNAAPDSAALAVTAAEDVLRQSAPTPIVGTALGSDATPSGATTVAEDIVRTADLEAEAEAQPATWLVLEASAIGQPTAMVQGDAPLVHVTFGTAAPGGFEPSGFDWENLRPSGLAPVSRPTAPVAPIDSSAGGVLAGASGSGLVRSGGQSSSAFATANAALWVYDDVWRSLAQQARGRPGDIVLPNLAPPG